MPPQTGETTLVTVFADVHYFFSPPDYKPCHHRFEKGSYIYIHSNPSTGKGRLEVANNAGTPEQDAFAGGLEAAHITYSYNKPTFLSINLSSGATQANQKPWQLPGFDLRNERKYMYNLNSIDLYLWMPEDAIDLVEALTQINSIGGLDIQDAPSPTMQDGQVEPGSSTLSPVVQQLEQVAVSPQYQPTGTSTAQSIPPQASSRSNSTQGTQAHADAAAAFAPMPYNPSAPAAPEARIYREKTPPPPDTQAGARTGTGPQQQYTPSTQPYSQQQQPYSPYGGPSHQYASTSQQPQQPQQSTPYFAGPPTQTQAPQQQTPSFAPPPASASPPQNPTYTPPTSQQQTSPAQQLAYSNYSYAANQQPAQSAQNIHQQFYIPTKDEAGRIPASNLPAHSLQPAQRPSQSSSKPASRTDRVEKGVNRLIKKLEKF